jgi:hypothetical protein
MNREQAGQLVRRVWLDYCRETKLPESHSRSAPWQELTLWEKEVDRRIGEAVARAALAEAESIARAIKSPTTQLVADVIAGLFGDPPGDGEPFGICPNCLREYFNRTGCEHCAREREGQKE